MFLFVWRAWARRVSYTHPVSVKTSVGHAAMSIWGMLREWSLCHWKDTEHRAHKVAKSIGCGLANPPSQTSPKMEWSWNIPMPRENLLVDLLTPSHSPGMIPLKSQALESNKNHGESPRQDLQGPRRSHFHASTWHTFSDIERVEVWFKNNNVETMACSNKTLMIKNQIRLNHWPPNRSLKFLDQQWSTLDYRRSQISHTIFSCFQASKNICWNPPPPHLQTPRCPAFWGCFVSHLASVVFRALRLSRAMSWSKHREKLWVVVTGLVGCCHDAGYDARSGLHALTEANISTKWRLRKMMQEVCQLWKYVCSIEPCSTLKPGPSHETSATLITLWLRLRWAPLGPQLLLLFLLPIGSFYGPIFSKIRSIFSTFHEAWSPD